MPKIPVTNKVPQVETFPNDVSRVRLSQDSGHLDQTKGEALKKEYLREAIENLTENEEARPVKESLLETEDDILTIKDEPEGVIVTDTKTKGGKLRRAISKSMTGWMDQKKTKIKKLREKPKVDRGAEIKPTIQRVEKIRKATRPEKLGLTSSVPLKKNLGIRKPRTEEKVSAGLQIKEKSEEVPSWSHVIGGQNDVSVEKPVVKKPAPPQTVERIYQTSELDEKTTVPKPITKTSPVVERVYKPAPVAMFKTEETMVTKTSQQPVVVAAKTPTPKKVAAAKTEAQSEPSEAVSREERARNAVEGFGTLIDKTKNTFGSLLGLALLIVLFLSIILTTSLIGRGGGAIKSTETEAVFTTLVNTDTIHDLRHKAPADLNDDLHILATANQGMSVVALPDDATLSTTFSLPTTIGFVNSSPFVIVNAGSYDSALGLMLRQERQLPSTLTTFLNIDKSPDSFTDSEISSQTARTSEDLTYLVTTDGFIILAPDSATIETILPRLK